MSLALLFGLVSWRRFLHPPDTYRSFDGRADAVVMFGGGGPRLATATALVGSGAADVLVLSDPGDRTADRPDGEPHTDTGRYCADAHDIEVLCFDPEPRTTRGESRYTAELARRRGWHHVVLVTTVEQSTRARMMLRRCWDGDIDIVGVDSPNSVARALAYEWAATARALLVRRGC